MQKPRKRRVLPVERILQHDDVSCGPACLTMVLRHHGRNLTVPEVERHVARAPDGGTTAADLGNAALALGCRADLYPLGVKVFDPTWWKLGREALAAKVRLRADTLVGTREGDRAETWHTFLTDGGHVHFHEPSPRLLMRLLDQGTPIICGLNSTWLYREARDDPDTNKPDDIGGRQVGHYVIVNGYAGRGSSFHLRDPHPDAPFDGARPAPVDSARLIAAVLLGDLTDDAVLLAVRPGEET